MDKDREREEFDRKMKKLVRESEGKILEVVIKWECQWELDKLECKHVQAFMANYVPRPPRRLVPRDACKLFKVYCNKFGCQKSLLTGKGGRFTTFIHAWGPNSANNYGEEMFLVSDVNALYPFIASSNVYPVGKFEIWISPSQLDNIQLCEKTKVHKCGDQEMIGLVQLTLRAPKDLFEPYLATDQDGISVFGLCDTCISVSSKKPCRHGDAKRDQTVTITWVEVNFVVSRLNYKIVKIFECYQYSNKIDLFSKFLQVLSHGKMQSSAPHDITSHQAYCDLINNEMKFPEFLK
jgi:hypothetical protein